MESLLNFYHELIGSPMWALRWPMAVARMLVFCGILWVGNYMWRTKRYFPALCCIVPLLYYLDAAVVQSLGNTRADTPTLVKTLVNFSWLGILSYLYYGCRVVDRLLKSGELVYYGDKNGA